MHGTICGILQNEKCVLWNYELRCPNDCMKDKKTSNLPNYNSQPTPVLVQAEQVGIVPVYIYYR